MSALLKAATRRRTPNQKSSGTLTWSILKLSTFFTKAGGALRANHLAEHHFVMFRHRHHTVPNWVLRHVVKPREIRKFVCDVTVPKLKPNFSPGRVIPSVELLSSFHVKLPKKSPQCAGIYR